MEKFVSLQGHLEEFAERTTTFMTFKVVSSLKLKQAVTSEWWLCFLGRGSDNNQIFFFRQSAFQM